MFFTRIFSTLIVATRECTAITSLHNLSTTLFELTDCVVQRVVHLVYSCANLQHVPDVA